MKAIAYYRVSTSKQEATGYGLDAQKTAVERYAEANNLEIVESYTEIESGKKADRPQLAAALDHAKQIDAKLLIAKLDRLARNVHFVSGLMQSGVKFTAVDMPTIDNLTIHILAAVSEQEAKLISDRTKAGLAAAKAKGVKLGNPHGWSDHPEAQKAGPAAARDKAISETRQQLEHIKRWRDDDGHTWREIAARLNDLGYRTRTGKHYHPTTAKRIYDRSG